MKKILLSICTILMTYSYSFAYTATQSDIEFLNTLSQVIENIQDDKKSELYDKITSLPTLSGRGGFLIQQIKEILENNINKPNYVNIDAVCQKNDGFYEKKLHILWWCSDCNELISEEKVNVLKDWTSLYFLVDVNNTNIHSEYWHEIWMIYSLTDYNCQSGKTNQIIEYDGNYEWSAEMHYLWDNIVNIFIYNGYMPRLWKNYFYNINTNQAIDTNINLESYDWNEKIEWCMYNKNISLVDWNITVDINCSWIDWYREPKEATHKVKIDIINQVILEKYSVQ